MNTGSIAAPYLRTSVGPGETQNLHKATDQSGLMVLRTSVGPGQLGAMTTRQGSGEATRPSHLDRGLSALKSAFDTVKATFQESFQALKENITGSRAWKAAGQVLSDIRSDTPTYGPPTARTPSPIDLTTPAKMSNAFKVYDTVLEEANKSATGQVTTFLRGQTEHNKPMAAAGMSVFRNLGIEIHDALPKNQIVALSAKHYDTTTTAFRDEKGTKIGFFNQGRTADASVSFMKGALETLFGSDVQSARALGAAFPKELKDLIATGLKAISDSNLGDEPKQEARSMFLSDIVLRVIVPQFSAWRTEDSTPPGILDKKETTAFGALSMKEVSKVIQTIANGKSLSATNDPLRPSVLKELQPVEAQTRRNMEAMLMEAGAGGTVHTPTDLTRETARLSDIETA